MLDLPVGEVPVNSESDWRSRIIRGDTVGSVVVPGWASECYAAYRRNVLADGYPCFFGREAEAKGSVYYSFADESPPSSLPDTLATFGRLCRAPPRHRNNLAVFFQPVSPPMALESYRDQFWETLRFLRDRDPAVDRGSGLDPEHALWEFPFAGTEFFVVGTCPAYRRRRSRNLGPGLVMLFQPREVFNDPAGNPISKEARGVVRERLARWDGLPAHPFLNIFGEPGNREWRQYFLPDDNQTDELVCPLSRIARG